MFFVFDLDGTLADLDHRLSHIQGDEKDWDAFFAACERDEPIPEIVAVARALSRSNHIVEIWTGRSDAVRRETENWLGTTGIRYQRLLMRPATDHRPDEVLKAGYLDTCDKPPDLVFEDRARVADMWRSHGIRCAQVAPGLF